MKHIASILIGAAFALCAEGTSMAKSYSFDTVDDYNSFLMTGVSGMASYSTNGGIGGGGSIAVSNGTGNNLPKYFTESDRLLTSEPITLSLNFQWTAPNQSATVGYGVVLGIGSNVSDQALTPYVSPYNESTTGNLRNELYVGIRTDGKDSNKVYFLNGSVSGLTHSTSYSGTNSATLTDGAWYSMSATFSPLGDSSGFVMTLSLSEADAATGVPGTQLLSGSVNILKTELLGGSVNSFFAVRSSAWSGVTHIDNVNFSSPIPEPSTVAALLVGSGALLLLGKKRRSRGPGL